MKYKTSSSIIIVTFFLSVFIVACGESDTSSPGGIVEISSHQTLAVGNVLPMAALNHPFADVVIKNKTKFTAFWSVGSSAYHHKNDASNIFYVIGDSTVTIKCRDSFKILQKLICPASVFGSIFPFSDSNLSIVKYSINEARTTVTVEQIITLKDSNGLAINGLLNPLLITDGKLGFNLDGEVIEYNANSLDSEALVKLSDGTFWIADEFAASLVHVDTDGRILKRLIPVTYESLYQDLNYPVIASLPAILSKRHVNRGIESLAVNPAETHLYFMMQSPLDNPDSNAYKTSSSIRLYKMNIADPLDIEEYLYVMDQPETFLKDNKSTVRKQDDVKVSEMLALDDNRLMVLEHISATTKIYTVDIDSSMILTASQSENLELNTTGIKPVTKHKVFDSDFVEGIPAKIEAMANLGNGDFLLINDNDFAVEGENTTATIVFINVN